MDSPYQEAGTSFSEIATQSAARKLRRTRQHLGSYRHDLVVAMRLVNNVEKEMLQAEWENWLFDENARCRQVQKILRENRGSISKKKIKGADSQQVIEAKELERSGKVDVLRKWQKDYCDVCKEEQKRLLDGRKHFTFGGRNV